MTGYDLSLRPYHFKDKHNFLSDPTCNKNDTFAFIFKAKKLIFSGFSCSFCNIIIMFCTCGLRCHSSGENLDASWQSVGRCRLIAILFYLTLIKWIIVEVQLKIISLRETNSFNIRKVCEISAWEFLSISFRQSLTTEIINLKIFLTFWSEEK
jgi:hypothetical protein